MVVVAVQGAPYSGPIQASTFTLLGAFKVPLFWPIIKYINITIKQFLRAKSGIMDRIMKQLIVN